MRGEHVVGAKKPSTGLLGFSQQAAEEGLNHYRKTNRLVPGGAGVNTAPRGVDAGEEGNANGTSIFDPVLCELVYRWFSPGDGAILDPFAGGSVRGIIAAEMGRRYTGIDLSAAQLEANEEQARRICRNSRPLWLCGDSTNVSALALGEYDFLFSCPPYADLERYSDDPRDLSTMSYPQFLAAYRWIIAQCAAMLRPDRFACFVVGDVREPGGAYRNFTGATIEAFEDAGLRLYNEAILVTMVGSLPVRVGKQFASSRKLGKTHQNVLVFLKGDAKKAAQACANGSGGAVIAPLLRGEGEQS
jgi:DNA modification methylase